MNELKRNLFSQASQTLVDYVYAYYNERGANRSEFFASNNMTFSANAFHAIGGFDESFRTAEDREICRRWRAGGGTFLYAPEVVMRHAHRLRSLSFLRQHRIGPRCISLWGKGDPAGVRAFASSPGLLGLNAGFPFGQHRRTQ